MLEHVIKPPISFILGIPKDGVDKIHTTDCRCLSRISHYTGVFAHILPYDRIKTAHEGLNNLHRGLSWHATGNIIQALLEAESFIEFEGKHIEQAPIKAEQEIITKIQEIFRHPQFLELLKAFAQKLAFRLIRWQPLADSSQFGAMVQLVFLRSSYEPNLRIGGVRSGLMSLVPCARRSQQRTEAWN